MDIIYSSDKAALDGLKLSGFFEGWPQKPSEEILRKSIENADYVVLAIDTKQKRLAGYITALSDKVLAAYIPFLEVEQGYRHHSIGHELVRKLLGQIDHLYMLDLVCDKELAGFYEEAGFKPWHAMIKRNKKFGSSPNFANCARDGT